MGNEYTTLDPDRVSLATLREHFFRTFARLTSEKQRTAPVLKIYDAFGQKLAGIIAQEQANWDAIDQADAIAIVADADLNRLALKVKVAIHGPRAVDITLPKHILYFGHRSVADAIRGILGPQLAMQKNWVDALLPQETDPAFTTLAQPMADAVKAGIAAKQAQDDARAVNAKFRLDGARRAIFDEYNTMLTEAFADLVAYAAAHPDEELPPDWPASFFLHQARDPGPQTVAEVDAVIAEREQELTGLQELRAELAAEAQAIAAAEAEAAQAEAEHEAAKKAEEAAKKAAKAAAAKAQAAKKKAKKVAAKKH